MAKLDAIDGQPFESTLSIVARALADGLRPDPITRPADWATDQLMVADGPMSGSKWSANLTPYLPAILNCLSVHDPCKKVAVRKSSQVGLTGLGIAWLGYIVDVAPANTLVVFPTGGTAKQFNREKLQPTLDATPVLRRKVSDQKSRSPDGSSTLFKKFNGGFVVLTGANSSADLRSKTIQFAFCDEIDEWPLDLDGQGDPMKMVDARQRAFHASGRYKKLVTSTPTTKGSSRIDDDFEGGDQRYYQVPCPHCDTYQRLTFDRLQFARQPPYNAQYACVECGGLIEHIQKRAMVAKGRWVAEKPDEGRYPSFHVDALISLLTTWDHIVAEYLEAGEDPQKLKGFYNLCLGESFEIKGEAPESEDLFNRARNTRLYRRGEVPISALMLTMGVDVQADRLEASVWGWGIGRTSYLIDHQVLEGDTRLPDVWNRLTQLYVTEYSVGNGMTRRIEMTAVDSGYRPTMTYNWTSGKPNTISVKGHSGETDWPISTTGKVIGFKVRGKRRKARNWMMGSSYLKQELYGHLGLDGPNEAGAYPPGYVHFPYDLDEGYFQQLTSEKLIAVDKRGGGIKYEWRRDRNTRNETLDCAVMARAAAYHRGMGQWTIQHWLDLHARRAGPEASAQLDLFDMIQPPAMSTRPGAQRAGPRRLAGTGRTLVDR